ncbi:MAG: urease accessory protein UreD [Actinomycetota bacterium]|nr:urease accessory protein UreD [Actinomycetota bacterium]
MSATTARAGGETTPQLDREVTRASDGLLDLEFTRGPDGCSRLRTCRQRFPLRTTMPFHLDSGAPDMAFVYVQNPTGGVFAGDHLLTKLTAGPGARVHLTSQSATKLYRMEGGEASQELRFELGAHAYIESIPDALIPQAGARYRQRTVVQLDAGAAFVGVETIAPGRRAHGERFAYELVEIGTRVVFQAGELCAERLRLEPQRAAPARPGVLGHADYLISLFAVAPDRDASLLAAAIDSALAAESGFRGAAGELPHGAGAMARMLAESAVLAERARRCAWGAARQALLGLRLPETRK